MTEQDKLFNQLQLAVIDGDEEKCQEICKQVIDAGINPVEAVKYGMGAAMEKLGNDYQAGICFIP